MPNLSSLQLATYEAALLQAAAFRNLTAFMTKALLPSKITMSEWSLMGTLAVHGSMRPSDIATNMDVKTPMTTRLVKSLADKDLISERTLSEDQRGKMIELTASGKNMLETQEIIIRGAMREYMNEVDRNDLASYLKVIEYLARRQP